MGERDKNPYRITNKLCNTSSPEVKFNFPLENWLHLVVCFQGIEDEM